MSSNTSHLESKSALYSDKISLDMMKEISAKTNEELIDLLDNAFHDLTIDLDVSLAINILKKRLGMKYEIPNTDSKQQMQNDGYPEQEIIPFTNEGEYFT